MKIPKTYIVIFFYLVMLPVLSLILVLLASYFLKSSSLKCDITKCQTNFSSDNSFYAIQGILINKNKDNDKLIFYIATNDKSGKELIVKSEFFPQFKTTIINYKTEQASGIHSEEYDSERVFSDINIGDHIGISIPVYDEKLSKEYDEKIDKNLLGCIKNTSNIINSIENPNITNYISSKLNNLTKNCSLYFVSIDLYEY